MKDFVAIDFQSDCTQDEILEAFKTHLPEFQWRGGDSDAQGLYVSGRNSDLVNVQAWLSETPMTATISFRNSWSNNPGRETLKQEMLNRIVDKVVPTLGTLLASADY
jgi:hypothetical protein